jgi:Flp pilus assembly protein TadD
VNHLTPDTLKHGRLGFGAACTYLGHDFLGHLFFGLAFLVPALMSVVLVCSKRRCSLLIFSHQNGRAGANVGLCSSASADTRYGQQEEPIKMDALITYAREDEQCSICLELVTSKSNFQLVCGHWYHTQCIKDLRSHGGSASCPNCREPLPPAPKEVCGRAVSILDRAAQMENENHMAVTRIYKHAAKLLRQAITEDPTLGKAHKLLGNLLAKQRDYVGAVASFKRATTIDPNDALSHLYLGLALHRQGESAFAVAALRRAISINPDCARAHFSLGSILYGQGDSAGAAAALKRAITIEPNEKRAHCNLGNALHLQHNTASAVAAYKRASSIEPNYATAHCNLGTAIYDQGESAGAVAAYQRAITLDPNCTQAHQNLGYVLGV